MSEDRRAWAFEAGRLLRFPSFRARVTPKLGEEVVMVAVRPDDTVAQMLDLMTHHDKGVLVVECEGSPHGVRLVRWEKMP